MRASNESNAVFRPETVTLTDQLAFGLVHRVGVLVIAVAIFAVLSAGIMVYVSFKYENQWLAKAGQQPDFSDPFQYWSLVALGSMILAVALSSFYSIKEATGRDPDSKEPAVSEPQLKVGPVALWDRELDG